jgi:hypothetical protein
VSSLDEPRERNSWQKTNGGVIDTHPDRVLSSRAQSSFAHETMEITVEGSLDQALRVLKRKLAKEGVLKE